MRIFGYGLVTIGGGWALLGAWGFVKHYQIGHP